MTRSGKADSMPSTTTTFGIDLGTTHSCIAHIEAGRPVVVRNAIGEETTPSVVYFNGKHEESVMVGTNAKNSMVLAPHLVASLVKRDMGKPGVSHTYHGREYTPEEISALILTELVRSTKESTGLVVRDVVITVPAYFGVAERDATRKAGDIAGLNVLDVLAEPVAAALHYQAEGMRQGTRHVLVCDLGGGTYDTTVIRFDGDDVRVVCTDGDPFLGGADWDALLARHLEDAFVEQHPRLDPTADELFRQDLHAMAEQLKKDLSSATSRRRDLRFAGAVARVEVTRAKLEELTADLLDRVVDITRRTVAAAERLGVREFDEVLLVGGMTKMPAVGQLLKERLGLEARLHEPDLAVAKGAARFAVFQQVKAGLGASRENVAADLGITADEAEAMLRKRVTTVVPRAFGVKATDPEDPVFATNPIAARQLIVHLLPANTPLPADTGPYPFATAIRNQRMVEIDVWEQAGAVASEELHDNRKVGRGILRDLPPRPVGSLFEVTFRMSETGTLSVHAVEPDSRAEVRFDLQIGGMTQEAVDAARSRIARHDVSG
jgi:molecular chaperone DnaK